MKKIINTAIFNLFFFLSAFIITTQVSANTINNIEMDVYIDANGNASITEVWNGVLNQGTEGYRPYTNLDNSTISNFSVSDETGIQYENLSSWNTGASFDNKAYKSGLHYISNGVELCWGISEYGNKTYTLKYVISNFVSQYTDTQGIYFNFINLDQNVGNAKITIHSDMDFSLENARIWAFGNNGTINFEEGKIVLNSNGYLSSSQYMVALVRFESNLFNINNISNKSFDDVYDSAMSDVDESELENDSENISPGSIFFTMIFGILSMLVFNPIIWLLVIFLVLKTKKGSNWIWGSGKDSNSLDFGEYGKILPNDDQINYWREVPCNKDLERAYWVSYNYNVVSATTLREGIIGAILLKWIKDGLITVSKTRKGLFNFKDNNYAIDFTNMQYASNEIENKLFGMLKEASGFNEVLEVKEFEKWCKKNYGKIQSWFLDFNLMEQAELEKQGLITSSQEETTGMFGSKRIITTKKVDQKLREEAIQLKGLKKFLLDFSMMPEREYFEVHIWEEYLIYAQLLGIADKVEEQFSKLYPKFDEETNLNTKITTIAIRNMVHLGYSGYEEGRRLASIRSSSSRTRDYSGSSRSSGGGGRSYSSGGSSSSGSSGGGFR